MQSGSGLYSMRRGGKKENTPNSMPGVDGVNAEGEWDYYI